MAYMLPQEIPLRNFQSISVGLSSPESILNRSHGEVTKPETINYRSYRPEKDGLFCEKIFGPTRDWECYCGKYKRIRYKGIICDRCGVEVTTRSVRRERFGHIQLGVPVVHIWFFRSLPNKIGHLARASDERSRKDRVLRIVCVVNPGPTGLPARHLLTEEEYYPRARFAPAGKSGSSE